MDSTLQCIVNFCRLLRENPRHPERHEPPLASLVKDLEVWEQLKRLTSELKSRSSAFYKTLKYRANRGECMDGLYVLMSFNSYFGSLSSENMSNFKRPI